MCQSNGEGSPLRESRARWSDETVSERAIAVTVTATATTTTTATATTTTKTLSAKLIYHRPKQNVVLYLAWKSIKNTERFLQGTGATGEGYRPKEA